MTPKVLYPENASDVVSSAGSDPISTSVGDLGGESMIDAVAESLDIPGSVCILVTPKVLSPENASDVVNSAGSDPISISAGDLGGESTVDVVAESLDIPGSVCILVTPKVPYPENASDVVNSAGSDPISISAGDLGGESAVDVAESLDIPGSVCILVTPKVPYPENASDVVNSAGSDPISISAGDLGGESTVDVVTESLDIPGSVCILVTPKVPYPENASDVVNSAGSDPISISAGDLGGESTVDVVSESLDISGSIGILVTPKRSQSGNGSEPISTKGGSDLISSVGQSAGRVTSELSYAGNSFDTITSSTGSCWVSKSEDKLRR